MPVLRLAGKTALPPCGRRGFERQENGAGFTSGQQENHGLFSVRRTGILCSVCMLIDLIREVMLILCPDSK